MKPLPKRSYDAPFKGGKRTLRRILRMRDRFEVIDDGVPIGSVDSAYRITPAVARERLGLAEDADLSGFLPSIAKREKRSRALRIDGRLVALVAAGLQMLPASFFRDARAAREFAQAHKAARDLDCMLAYDVAAMLAIKPSSLKRHEPHIGPIRRLRIGYHDYRLFPRDAVESYVARRGKS